MSIVSVTLQFDRDTGKLSGVLTDGNKKADKSRLSKDLEHPTNGVYTISWNKKPEDNCPTCSLKIGSTTYCISC